MPDSIVVKIQRVLKDDKGIKPIAECGRVAATIPADGFIVFADNPGIANPASYSLFVRDSDLQKAIKVRTKKGRSVPIDADSWDGDEE